MINTKVLMQSRRGGRRRRWPPVRRLLLDATDVHFPLASADRLIPASGWEGGAAAGLRRCRRRRRRPACSVSSGIVIFLLATTILLFDLLLLSAPLSLRENHDAGVAAFAPTTFSLRVRPRQTSAQKRMTSSRNMFSSAKSSAAAGSAASGSRFDSEYISGSVWGRRRHTFSPPQHIHRSTTKPSLWLSSSSSEGEDQEHVAELRTTAHPHRDRRKLQKSKRGKKGGAPFVASTVPPASADAAETKDDDLDVRRVKTPIVNVGGGQRLVGERERVLSGEGGNESSEDDDDVGAISRDAPPSTSGAVSDGAAAAADSADARPESPVLHFERHLSNGGEGDVSLDDGRDSSAEGGDAPPSCADGVSDAALAVVGAVAAVGIVATEEDADDVDEAGVLVDVPVPQIGDGEDALELELRSNGVGRNELPDGGGGDATTIVDVAVSNVDGIESGGDALAADVEALELVSLCEGSASGGDDFWEGEDDPRPRQQQLELNEMCVIPTEYPFVSLLRHSSPYIVNHRDTLVVYHVPGNLIEQTEAFGSLMDDVALTHLFGMKIVVVVGCRTQITRRLGRDGKGGVEAAPNGLRITTPKTLRVVEEEAGFCRFEVERTLNRCLRENGAANCNVVSGCFFTAAPYGMIDGVDYKHTGYPTHIQTDKIHRFLSHNDVVLLTPLGFTTKGDAINVDSECLAAFTAGDLGASKIVYFASRPMVLRKKKWSRGDSGGSDDGIVQMIRRSHAQQIMSHHGLSVDLRTGFPRWNLNADAAGAGANDERAVRKMLLKMGWATHALQRGVERAHVVTPKDGALIEELFTARRGYGTCISQDDYEAPHPDDSNDDFDTDANIDGNGDGGEDGHEEASSLVTMGRMGNDVVRELI